MGAAKQPVWSIFNVRLGAQVPLVDSVRIARLFGENGSFASTSAILAALEKACEGETLTTEELAEVEKMRSAAAAARLKKKGGGA